MNSVLRWGSALGLCLIGLQLAVAQNNDSTRVVKGQVSDYFIPISKDRIIEGKVADRTGSPLEGATVMIKSSPIHCNTDRFGNYSIKANERDSILFVYFPGKRYEYIRFSKNDTKLNVSMIDEKPQVATPHQGAIATKWFNPQSNNPTTFCNPVNISYNFEPYNGNVRPNGSFRSSADPMMLTYKGEYLLFSTNQGGFFRSKDMAFWDFVPASFQRQPTDDDQCAPAAFVSGDTLFYTGSTYEGLPIWYSVNPFSGRFKRLVEKNDLPTWDPCLFLDDDGKLYEYYGSSNEYPLKAVQIDRRTFKPVSKIQDAVRLYPKIHGWERFGMNNDDSTTLAPFTEGAYMTKHNGKYYLQYGAPGTEFKVYADGVYTSDSPLGPFEYQSHNPMSYKPGGFIQGAGHGGTFQDLQGNYWHVATCMLSLKYKFERRIGIYPVNFDKEGVMYATTSFGDYPTFIPSERANSSNSTFPGWMLLSYKKPVKVSSFEEGCAPELASDENMRTYWAAKSGEPGEWIEMDLGGVKEIRAFQLNYYDHKAFQHNRANDLYHQYQLYASNNGLEWFLVVDKSDNDVDQPHEYVELSQPLRARYLKVVNKHMAAGSFALSDWRVFGNGLGATPTKVESFEAQRDLHDSRNVLLKWRKSQNSYGYNIYYGLAANKLYNCITVMDDLEYNFRGLDAGQTYYFALEAIGENGKSTLSEVVKVN